MNGDRTASPAGSDALPAVEIDVKRYLRLIRKRKWYALGALAISCAIGLAITASATPTYVAQSSMFIGQRQVSIAQLQAGLQLTNLSSQLIESYTEIVKSRSIAQRAVNDGGLEVTPSQIRSGLQAFAVADTQVIRLLYYATDPDVAERVTNGVARAFAAEIEAVDSTDPNAAPAVQVSIIDPAVASSSPVSPNAMRNMSLAGIIGLIVGVGLAFLIEQLDQSVKTREELEQMGLSVLGFIPELDTHGEEVYLEEDTQGLGGEAFRKLRTSIGFLGVESPLKAILVTSAVSQEGKTTLALNLASAYALGGFRTLLVEADLRRPSLHRTFGTYGTRGLTTVIVGAVALEDAVVHTQTRNLSVLLAGAIPPNPVELLASEQMVDVLRRLKSSFDVVIVDSPPLTPVADPAALAGRCDGVVMVARAGKTDRRRLLEGVQIIERAGGRLLGVALNFLTPGQSSYAYEYYYYGYRSPRVGEAENAGVLQRHG